jgi:fructokinase
VEKRRFLVVGEALVDIVRPAGGTLVEEAPGGSPLNVAVGLSRLGHEAALVTALGDDERSRVVVEHLAASEVELLEGSVEPGARTSTATAHLDETGAASYTFDLRWELGARALPAGVQGLHVGSLGITLRPGRDSVVDLVRQAAEAGLLVSVDPNARPTITPDAEQAWADVREVAELAGVVKLSDEDLSFFRPGHTLDEVARALLAGPTRLVVMTLGGGGAVAVSEQGSVVVPSAQTSVVDTVGAGDSFMAALLAVVAEHGLEGLGERRLQQYVEAAHRAAAITVSRRGADPPRRHELPKGWPDVD